jgi:uncharacterized glyoxalase superfamily protein PhnB
VVALEPRPGFVADLGARIRAELAPLLLGNHLPDRLDAPSDDPEEKTMTTARSPVTTGLQYRAAPAAIVWLVDTFDFRVEERHDMPDGTVAHARLGWHGGQVFVSTRHDGRVPWAATGPASISLNTTDPSEVDALHARALAARADLVTELEDTPYGSHQFSVRDPEGNLWTVGTYLPPISLP